MKDIITKIFKAVGMAMGIAVVVLSPFLLALTVDEC